MAATATPQKIASKVRVDEAVGATGDISFPSETGAARLDMSGYEAVMFVVRGAGVTGLDIEASDDSAGSTNNYTVRARTFTALSGAANFAVIEATAEQLQDSTSSNRRYVTVQVTGGTPANVTAIRTKARFAHEDLTADYTA